MERYYLTDFGHVLLAGSTGSGSRYGGKTTTGNWWHDHMPGHVDVSVFFTPERDDSIRGQRVRSLEGLAKSYRAGKRQFYYHARGSSMEPETLVSEHENLIQMLRRLPGAKAVFHDEGQVYRESSGFRWCLEEGGNIGEESIKSVVLSQRPDNLGERALNLLTTKCWVGPVTPEGEQYFKRTAMAEVASRLKGRMQPYQWAVTDGGELLHVNDPVPKKYA